MVIAHNISAINTYNKMGISATATDKSMEKLSSGYKINRAADDAAGLSISEKMRSQIRGLNQASENAENGISMIQTAEGALNEAHTILQRMRELAVQAANDTNAASDRAALQSEIDQLTSEINRIGNTTEFNGMKILNGSKIKSDGKEEIEVAKGGTVPNPQASKGATNTAKLTLVDNIKFDNTDTTKNVDYTKLQALDDTSTIVVQKENGKLYAKIDLVQAKSSTEKDVADPTAQAHYEPRELVQDANGNWTYNEHGISFSFTKDSVQEFITNGKDTDMVKLDLFKCGTAGTNGMDVTSTTGYGIQNDYESDSSSAGTISDITLDAYGTGNTRIDYDRVEIEFQNAAAGSPATIKTIFYSGSDAKITETVNINGLGELTDNGTAITVDANGLSYKINPLKGLKAGDKVHLIVDLDDKLQTETVTKNGQEEDNSVYFHVGANTNQFINTTFGDMRAHALGLTGNDKDTFTDEYTVNNGTDATPTEKGLNISTRKGANKAIEVIDSAIQMVSNERSKYGSIQNRLEYTINNLDTTSENMTSAESTVRDVDMASEMMEMTKNQILQQASQAMLAQAMQRPQQVLQLLQ